MRSMTLFATLAFLTAMLAGSIEPEFSGPDPSHVFVGPYAGVLESGGTATEHYQNVPDGTVCIAIVQPYDVHVVTTPPGVPVQVSVGAHTAISTGSATLSFERGVCAHFHIDVENLGEAPVAYALHVTSGLLAGPVCNACIATS